MLNSYPTSRSSRRLALQLAGLVTLVTVAPAAAATFTYTPVSGTGDLWSAGTHWDAVPVSSFDTRLTFVGDNLTPLADSLVNVNTDDVSDQFSLNILDLQGTGPAAGGASITVNAAAPATGLTLVTDLSAPVVNLNALAGASGLTYQVNPVLTLANDATFIGAGTATFKFSGGIIGDGRTLTKSGASLMSIGGTTTLESLHVGFNNGVAGNNGAGGKITAAAGSTLSVGTGTGAIRVGSINSSTVSPTAVGALDLSAATSFTANVTEFFVGVNYGGMTTTGEGTLNLSPANTITATTTFAVGRSAGNFNTPLATGTVPANSATIVNTPRMAIGQGKSNASFTVGSNSTFDVNGVSGGRAELWIGHHDQTGSGNWSTTADFGNGPFRGFLSTISVGRKFAASTGNTTGTATFGNSDQNDFNLSASGSPLVVGRVDAGTSGVATGTLTIGHLGSNSTITSTNNGTAILIATGAGTAQRAVGTLNLGPGSLTLNTTGAGISGDTTNLLNTGKVKFNGTTLIAGGASTGFIQGLDNAEISDGGLTIASNSNITIPQGLSHDPAGAAIDGGLTKDNPGILTLPSTNTYTGTTTIAGGIIFFTKTAALPGFATPGRLSVGELGGLGMNVGGAGEFTLAQLDTYRTDGTTFTGTHHPLILDTANAGGELTYTTTRSDMGSFVKRGSHKLTLDTDVDIKGGLDIGISQNGGTLAIAAGKDFSLAPSELNGLGAVNLGVAGGTNSLGTLDASAADSFSMEASTLRLGVTTGSGTAGGTLSLPATSSITAHTEIVVADSNNTFNNVNSTITTAAGGTAQIRTPRLWIGHGKGRGFLTLGAGSTLDLAHLEGGRTAVEVGNNTTSGGSGGWTGTVDLSAGVFKGELSSLLIGATSATSATSSAVGTMTLSNSPLNHLDIEGAGSPLTIGRYTGSTSGTATGTLTLGNLDADSSITSTDNGTAILIATGGGAGAAKATGTLNLNGGTLTITTTGSALRGDAANPDNVSTVNFNGITLKAGASSTDWIGNLKTANIAAGGLTLDTNGFDIAIAQVLSGTGSFTKSGTGALICYDANSYSGSTTVSAGALSLADVMLSDTAAVTVAAGAVLDLAYPAAATDTVLSLSLGGVPASIGVWGAVGSGAPNTSALITGIGRLNVLTGPAGSDPYDTWASQITNPDDRDRSDDADHDGFSNELEYLFGTSPVANDGALVQSSLVGTNLIVRWNQLESGGIYQLQESLTLVDSPWPVSVVVPVIAADQGGVPSSYDRMEATVPIDGARKFVRVSGLED
ncbi:autotransporter-associated beta strand repeat-containing protein [Luteolibacter arcticus]|uniref:Autotransporter-associated beta strand repeat-containing protein n=1 Tax=Luteolibacter arcticus TaxID=1581411 RepID=A0ABT3GFY0_9BACT|nr:autotransporter-associated beta strand repeat-containing protein [Luteolibacter arcticus]MCW1922333.1 autotransporter-associated beta strand repeat-containing protein [Luteolibacter arcticus]